MSETCEHGRDLRSSCVQCGDAGPKLEERQRERDTINPAHYKSHPSGIECIVVTEHMSFNLGNAVKYIWRAGLKNTNPSEDLKKAIWYLERELKRRST